MLSTVSVAISVIAGISLVVGGIGVMNMMLVAVNERRREIGVRLAVGARRGEIVSQRGRGKDEIEERVQSQRFQLLLGGIVGQRR